MLMTERTRSYANGAIEVTNFKKLNSIDFPMFDLKNINDELMLCSNNGKLYINSRFKEKCKVAVGVFEILAMESKEALLNFQRTYQKKYPNIKSFDDLAALEGTNEDKVNAFAMLSVPVELKRREIESAYYGKAK